MNLLPVTEGLLIPFIGTTIGAAFVFFLKKSIGEKTQKALNGFASGVMVSASFFSLLLPALEQNEGTYRFVAPAIGFLLGMLFLLILDWVVPHVHMDNSEEGPKTGLKRTTKLILAVTLHNLPEGMAVGVVYAGFLYGNSTVSLSAALALAVGIAIQNIPEGAIVSMPLKAEGMTKGKTFFCGMMSGIVEPLGAVLVIIFAKYLVPVMPYLLSFAAGAMIYVVVEELIPEMSEGKHSNIGTICFAAGFVLMMALDVALG